MANNIQELLVVPLGDGSLTPYIENNPPITTTSFYGSSGTLSGTAGDTLPVFAIVLSGNGTIETAVLTVSGGSVVFVEVASSGSGEVFNIVSGSANAELSILAEFIGKKIISNGTFNTLAEIDLELFGRKVISNAGFNSSVEIDAEFAGDSTHTGAGTVSLLVQVTGAGTKVNAVSSIITVSVNPYAESVKFTSNGSNAGMAVGEYMTTIPVHWGTAIIRIPIEALGEGEGIHPPLIGMQLQSCISQKTNLKSEILQWQSFC